ncbi:alpha-L-fucosidase [Arcicella sp. BE140]|nr:MULTISPECIES: alpha-L-fucosidase [unclassified Arcicella]MDR6562375.1 alpha-L-fucosidase [Arcicella sp. BE51]MDR6812269.1 alpha-L-fucosidase [Arcicella sp. BE140]MDR6823600.1 alpha-L-fucosidase [Arcicella sp. BE139]
MKNNYINTLLFLAFSFTVWGQTKAPEPLLPVPSKNQLRWQQMEYYSFIHFSVNTYTDMAWGLGNEDPKIFNPTKLDCRQWARICKQAGMKGIIFTAKHHSGFCLWPSKYTDYSVKNAPWRNGKGDMVKELADACREYGLKFGVYLSPWDRNHPDYGKPEYITYFRNQLTELLTNYGEIFEVWFDGANGGSGYYGGANETRKIDAKTYYDWQNTYKLVRKLQPNIVIWNDGGDRADLRWVGTEAGYVGETNWSLLNATGDVPDQMLRHGVENGNAWVPGEVNTSIRPEWFYHPKEDKKVKTLPQLMDTYYNSVGRNGTLLLNFPIMPNGLIHETDEKNVLAFAQARREAFSKNLLINTKNQATNVRGKSSQFAPQKAFDQNKESYWATDDSITKASLTMSFAKPTAFNRFLIQEPIWLGQRVKAFTLEAKVNDTWQQIAKETTIGYKRILRFNTVKATQIRLNITDAKACPLISNIEVYQAPIILTPPQITRNQAGEVHITPTDAESELFYTLDGSIPTSKSSKYTDAIDTGLGKVTVKAIAFSPQNKLQSEVAEEKFEIARKHWSIVGIQDKKALHVLDGNEYTSWQKDKVPTDLIIDLGKEENLIGFRYLPDQNWWAEASIISQYQFYVSNDNSNWQLVSEGEFANIKNNPTWQIKEFAAIKARYIKLKALKNIQENAASGYAELDILTN